MVTTVYVSLLYYARTSTNEVLRVGAAGSLTMLIGESTFYCIDAVNAKSKIMNVNLGFFEMVPKIISEEGVYGLYKGYSVSYYSSMYSGFIYFYTYKMLKVQLKEKYAPKTPT
jgi:hypothetical protein